MHKIRIYPDPVLTEEARSVERIDEEIKSISSEMIDIMYENEGVGLAAPQIGISLQIIVIDIGDGPFVMYNPEITEKNDDQEKMEEGCLSIPGVRLKVLRSTKITIKGLDKNGEKIELKVEGLPAKVFQHEIDHLLGVLIIDYASSVQKSLIKSKLKDLEKGNFIH